MPMSRLRIRISLFSFPPFASGVEEVTHCSIPSMRLCFVPLTGAPTALANCFNCEALRVESEEERLDDGRLNLRRGENGDVKRGLVVAVCRRQGRGALISMKSNALVAFQAASGGV